MYERVNELLRVRKTREGKMERGAIKERARSNVEIAVQKRGGIRLKRCQVTSGVVNISRRETSRGDERKKMIWEEKLIKKSCHEVMLTLQIQRLSSEAK